MDITSSVRFVESFSGISLTRHYNPHAPKGVNGRNSDNTRIQQLLGWEPSISLVEGMRHTYDWIEQHIVQTADIYASFPFRD